MNTRDRLLAGTLAAAVSLLALGLGYWWGAQRAHADAAPTVAPAVGDKVLYWYDPMVPDQHFDKPGKSPFMDMQLVPKYAGDAAGASGVQVAPEVRQNLGIRTAFAVRGSLPAAQRLPGTVAWNLREEQVLSLPVDAVVERLYVRAPFEPVQAGQVLLSVRAPEWSAALAEAQALRSARSPEARALQGAAGGRLRALGLPAGARVDARGAIALVARSAGVATEVGVREGESVPAGTPMLRVNGRRSLWVEAAVPASAVGSAQPGTPVQVRADAVPGETMAGRVEALLPQVDAATRTQRARIVLDQPDPRLAAGQFVQVEFGADADARVLLVPSGAVITDGLGSRVIVLAGGRFVPTVVRTGRSAGGQTEILEGLKGGEKIVVSGQFLIDSEANLSGALERLQPAGKAP